jgi:signal transduction histidine kinase
MGPVVFARHVHDAHDEEVSGLGLGLFITRSIIEEHDGRVWAESQPETGSTFSLALPAAEKLETG